MSTKSFRVTMFKDNGKLLNQNPAGYNQFLSIVENGEELVVEFKRKRFEKTNAQLRLAYKLLAEIRLATGNSIEGLDLFIKKKLGKCYIEKIEGEEMLNCSSKADFTKEEMESYINELILLCQKYEVPVQLDSL